MCITGSACTEFTDLITISQMTPGPIAINAATFVGMKLTGMPGAVVATLGYITPSCIIVTIIAKLYLKYREMDMLQGILGGIRPAVVALIGSAGISILQTAFWGVSGKMVISNTSWLMVGIFVVCVILLRKVKMNPIWVMVLGRGDESWRGAGLEDVNGCCLIVEKNKMED